MTKDFNAASQPVYCMFFPYREDFKTKLDNVQHDNAATQALCEGALKDIVMVLEQMPLVQEELYYPPEFTEDGLYFGGSAGIMLALNAAVLTAFEAPRPTSEAEAKSYVSDQEFANAEEILTAGCGGDCGGCSTDKDDDYDNDGCGGCDGGCGCGGDDNDNDKDDEPSHDGGCGGGCGGCTPKPN